MPWSRGWWEDKEILSKKFFPYIRTSVKTTAYVTVVYFVKKAKYKLVIIITNGTAEYALLQRMAQY